MSEPTTQTNNRKIANKKNAVISAVVITIVALSYFLMFTTRGQALVISQVAPESVITIGAQRDQRIKDSAANFDKELQSLTAEESPKE